MLSFSPLLLPGLFEMLACLYLFVSLLAEWFCKPLWWIGEAYWATCTPTYSKKEYKYVESYIPVLFFTYIRVGRFSVYLALAFATVKFD